MGGIQAPQDGQDVMAPFTPVDQEYRLSDTRDDTHGSSNDTCLEIGPAFGIGLGLEEDVKPDVAMLDSSCPSPSQVLDQNQDHTQLFPNTMTSFPLSDSLYTPVPTRPRKVPKRYRQCAKSAPASRHSTPTHSRPIAASPGKGNQGWASTGIESGSGNTATCWRSTPGESVTSTPADRCARPRARPRSNSFQIVRFDGGVDDFSVPFFNNQSLTQSTENQQPPQDPPHCRRALLRSRPIVPIPESHIACLSRPPAIRPPIPGPPTARNHPTCSSVSATNRCKFTNQRRTGCSVNVGAAMPGPSTGGSAPITKRSASEDAGDGNASASSSSSKTKLARVDRSGEDFSSVVKSRLSSYTRTGQACDRCKVRKIRCDAHPEGCSHCANLGLECYVTDRVTGRTERRGYIQELEREAGKLNKRMEDLEKLLRDKGIEVKPEATPADTDGSPRDESASGDDGWQQYGCLMIKDDDSEDIVAPSRQAHIVPKYPGAQLESGPEQNNFGTGGDSKPLSSFRGTKLFIMGTTIDTAVFKAPDVDEPPTSSPNGIRIYNKSVHAFVQSVMGVKPPVDIVLPPREEGFTYSKWFFLVMARFTPVLHGPTHMALLERVYDEEGFVPSTPELVQIHMVFAIMYYQTSLRNAEESESLNEISNKHYHFALSKVSELMILPEVAAVQSIVLIATHTRAFPKPGCGTLISNLAFQRALDLNLNLAPKVPRGGTNLDAEVHKRTWWVLLSVFIYVTGRCGRPMPMTVQDFDVPMPVPVNDELLTKDGVREPQTEEERRPLDWAIALHAFRIVPIILEMYTNIHGVRRNTQQYPEIIEHLEKELQKWDGSIPQELSLDQPDLESQPQKLSCSVYVKTFGLETRLWMRHNSVNPVPDKELIAENSRICEETSLELLSLHKQLMDLKSLDITWTAMTTYVLCLFTILVAHWERRHITTPEDVATLRNHVDTWMAIIKTVSQLIGSGPEIQNEIKHVVDLTMSWIERDMQQGNITAAAATTATTTPAPAVRLKKDRSASNQGMNPRAEQSLQVEKPQLAINTSVQGHAQHLPPQPHSAPPQADMPALGGFYPDPSLDTHGPYPGMSYDEQAQGSSMMNTTYGGEATTMFYPNTNIPGTAPAGAAASTGVSGTPGNHHIAFSPQATQHGNPTSQFFWPPRSNGNAWHDWTAAMAQLPNTYNTDNFMNLGNTTATSPVHTGPPVSMAGGNNPAPHEMQWPMMLFDQQTAQGPPPHHMPHQHPHQHPQPHDQHNPHHHPHSQQHHHGAAGV